MSKARRNTVIATCLCYLIAIVFLILTIIGNVAINPILNDIYFFKLDVSQVIPISVENSNLLNSVARSLGLHDFYQVGLWNFCEGYDDEGVTHCSPPKRLFWFNPVQVLVSELLAGAKIALPSQVLTILHLLRIGQQVMFAFFIAAAALTIVLLMLSPFALRARWASVLLALLGSIAGVLVTVAVVIASVISIAAKVAMTAQDQLNIRAQIGVKMFVFMWIAALSTDLGFLLMGVLTCWCLPEKRAEGGLERHEMREKGSRFSVASFTRRRNDS